MPAIAWTLLKGQRDTAAKFWFAGTACYAGTVTLFALQTALPSAVNTFFGFGLIALMLAFLAESLRRELYCGPTPWTWIALTVGVSLVIFGYAAYFESAEMARVTQLCIVSLLDVGIVWLLMRVIKHSNSRALIFVLLAFLTVVITNALRIYAFFKHDQSPMLLTYSVTSNIGFIANYLSVVLYSFGYWGFVIEKNRAAVLSEISLRTEAQTNELKAIHREHLMQELVSERNKLIEKLARAQQAAQAGALSASVAHEINQPLASIQLSIDEAINLQGSGKNPARLKDLLGRITSENQRAAAIIRRLQDIFKGKSPEPEQRTLDAIVRELCSVMKTRTDESGVRIELNLSANVPVRSGAGELDHVILNLITNSLSALSDSETKNPCITIKTFQSGSNVNLEVTDNGPGIGEDMRDRVFDLFSGTNSGGMGLGLWLSRHILERNGGSIRINKQESAKGAGFLIQLSIQ